MPRRYRSFAFATLLFLAGALLLGGCFTTTLSLLAPGAAPAKVDPAYCGDWHFTWKESGKDGEQTKSADLIVRNFDGAHYYVEWKEEGNKSTRMNGVIVPVKSAMFAQLSDLGDKGELSDNHLILRVQLSGDKLTLRHLKQDFFKEVKTDEALRQTIEQNVDNDAMYEESATGSLISQP